MEEKTRILDEQSNNQINQLHNTVVNLSKQSFEIKKLYIITLTAALSMIFQRGGTSIFLTGMSITILFYVVDSLVYFYQRNLRNAMIREENKIYQRHGIKEEREKIEKCKLFHAFFNTSQVLYFLTCTFLCIYLIATPIFIVEVVL